MTASILRGEVLYLSLYEPSQVQTKAEIVRGKMCLCTGSQELIFFIIARLARIAEVIWYTYLTTETVVTGTCIKVDKGGRWMLISWKCFFLSLFLKSLYYEVITMLFTSIICVYVCVLQSHQYDCVQDGAGPPQATVWDPEHPVEERRRSLLQTGRRPLQVGLSHRVPLSQVQHTHTNFFRPIGSFPL